MPYSKSLRNQTQIMPEDLTDNVLLFMAGDTSCAIPLLRIATVIRMIEITPVPKCREMLNEMFPEQNGLTGIAGCIKYHGELIPVYHINSFFGEKMKKPALKDNLIIVDAGTNGTSMLSALWVKSITGVYGRNDLFRIKKCEINEKNCENNKITVELTANDVNGLGISNNKKSDYLKPGTVPKKEVSGDKENSEENEGYIDSCFFGLKIYSSDLDSLILVIEDINEFLFHGRSGRFTNILHQNLKTDLKKRQFLNDLLMSDSRLKICSDINSENSEAEKSESIKIASISSEVVPVEISAKSLEDLEEEKSSEELKKIKAILNERTKQIERPYGECHESETIEILRFRLNYKEYAFVMKYIREVLIYNKLTPVPGTPDYISGIFALRGEIISLVDLRNFFSLHCRGLTDLNLVIILTNGAITFGILADYITDIGTISSNRLKAPDENTGIKSKYIKGIVDDSLIVLDAEALLSDPAMIIDER